MWLLFFVVFVIGITFFFMVNSNEKFKLSGKFRHIKKNKFQHEINGGKIYQESFIQLIGPKINNSIEQIVTAFLIRDFDQQYGVMVLVNDLKLGYLSDDDAIKFIKLLKLNNLSDNAGINVQALIYGNWRINGVNDRFRINLNICKNLSDSEII